MKIIILAAGKGSRLKLDTVPKCLAKIDGRPILGWQLEALSYFKPDEIIIVAGFRIDLIKDYLSKNYKMLNIRVVENQTWQVTDNLYSLGLALNYTNETTIIINGDVVFHRDIMRLMYKSPRINTIATIRKPLLDSDDMKAKIKDNKVIELGKELQYNENDKVFQALGIYKVENILKLKEAVTNCEGQKHFNTAIHSMLSDYVFESVDITNFPAIEIDFPEDLIEAQHMFKWNAEDWNQGQRTSPPINIQNAIDLLLNVKEVFAKYNISWFLCFGTSLGAYRSEKLIEWDTDLDIGCYLEDREKVLEAEKELLDKGCYIPFQTNYYYDRWYIKNKEKIELHFFERIGEQRVYDIFRCNFRYPAYMIENLVDIELESQTFKIPSDTERFIIFSYGKKWKIPIKHQQTTQISHSGNKHIVLVCGIYDPARFEDLMIFDKLVNKGNIVVAVHSDEYLMRNGIQPRILDEMNRRQIARHLKQVADSLIALDKDNTMCETIKQVKPEFYFAGSEPILQEEIDLCNNLGIEIIKRKDLE